MLGLAVRRQGELVAPHGSTQPDWGGRLTLLGSVEWIKMAQRWCAKTSRTSAVISDRSFTLNRSSTTLTLTLTPQLRHNFRHLYFDVFWYGVLAGSALAFVAIYAARLGASSVQVGIITAGPAAANLFISLPAGRWLETRNYVRATFTTSLWHRAGYLLLIFLPLVVGDDLQVWLLLALITAMSVPGTVLAIAFNSAFADVVPPEWRGHVVGRRNALLAVSLSLTSLACGRLLDSIAFPLNYQVVFAVGALGAAMSSYHLGRVQAPGNIPPRVGRPLMDAARPGVSRFADVLHLAPGLRFLRRSRGRPLLRPDLIKGAFGLFLLSYFIFYGFQYIPVPLFPLFFVQRLQLTDGAISVGSALYYAAMVIVSLAVRPLSDRIGHRRTLIVGAVLYSLYPLLIALARDATLYWLASFVGGGVWALVNAGLLNRLMEQVTPEDRPAHMALHNIVLNLGILGGSLSGPVLGNVLGLQNALLLSAALRFFAGVLIGAWS